MPSARAAATARCRHTSMASPIRSAFVTRFMSISRSSEQASTRQNIALREAIIATENGCLNRAGHHERSLQAINECAASRSRPPGTAIVRVATGFKRRCLQHAVRKLRLALAGIPFTIRCHVFSSPYIQPNGSDN